MKKILNFCFPVLVFVIVLVFVSRNEILALNAPPLAPSATIIDKYTRHVENWNYSCLDSSKCTSASVNSSGQNVDVTTVRSPYTYAEFNALNHYFEFSGSTVKTINFAKQYGVSSTYYNGYFDEKVYNGTITNTSFGPKGSSSFQTLTIPPKTFRLDLINNGKGSDTSSNWIKVIDGKDVYGVWETYSYSTDSKRHLVVTGDANRMYTITLYVSAYKWRLNNAADAGSQDFNPRELIIEGLPCGALIKIMNKNLNNSCEVQITVPGSGEYDITPVVLYQPKYGYSNLTVMNIVDSGPVTSIIADSTIPDVLSSSPTEIISRLSFREFLSAVGILFLK